MKFICPEMTSPFFTPIKGNQGPPLILPTLPFYEDRKYLLTNCTARIEEDELISNIYFNGENGGI